MQNLQQSIIFMKVIQNIFIRDSQYLLKNMQDWAFFKKNLQFILKKFYLKDILKKFDLIYIF